MTCGKKKTRLRLKIPVFSDQGLKKTYTHFQKNGIERDEDNKFKRGKI